MSALTLAFLLIVVCGISYFIEDLWHRQYADNGFSEDFTTIGLGIIYDIGTVIRVVLFIKFLLAMGWISA